MNGVNQSSDDLVIVIRWVARIIALSLAIIVAFFVTGEGVNPGEMNSQELIMAITFLVMWTGLIVAWRWDGIGGAMITCGAILFQLLDFFFTGTLLQFWVYLFFLLPGFLFLYCWWQSRHERST